MSTMALWNMFDGGCKYSLAMSGKNLASHVKALIGRLLRHKNSDLEDTPYNLASSTHVCVILVFHPSCDKT